MKTVHEVLIEHGFDCVEGYVFDYEKDADHPSIIIGKEEIMAFLSREPKKYYAKPLYEDWVDEENALENIYDDEMDVADTDLPIPSFEEWKKNKLKEE
jgi:hypothetical protein